MSVPSFDPENPLNQCPGENKAAAAALNDYYRLGVGRSLSKLIAVYKQTVDTIPPTRRVATLHKWSAANMWQARVDAQSAIDREAEKKAKQAAMEAEAKLWAERRMKVRERDWAQGERLRTLVEQMLLEGPEYIKTWEQVDRDTGSKTVHHAMDAKLMVTAIKIASDIQRRAAEMETEHVLNENVPAADMDALRKKRWEDVQAALGEALASEPETQDIPEEEIE